MPVWFGCLGRCAQMNVGLAAERVVAVYIVRISQNQAINTRGSSELPLPPPPPPSASLCTSECVDTPGGGSGSSFPSERILLLHLPMIPMMLAGSCTHEVLVIL